MANSIQIFVQSHKPIYVPEHDLLVPLQIGSAGRDPIDGMIQDNTGDNISHKNANYCEMTGQYWVWKNLCCRENNLDTNANGDDSVVDAEGNGSLPDYVGFYHYRRYLRFTEQKHPYEILSYPDEATLAAMGYDAQTMEDFIRQYDIIVPVPEDMYETAWENYNRAPDHFAEDLLAVSRIVIARHPDYAQAVNDYLGGTAFYLKNMYIMKRDLFDAYCSWLFPILEEFDATNDWGKYKGDMAANRVDGYLAERLFGIWFTKQKQNAKAAKATKAANAANAESLQAEETHVLRYAELPRVHFADMDGGRGSLKKMQLVNTVLPSGTRRRSIVSRAARFALKQKANLKYR